MTTATCIAPISISLETKKRGYVEIVYPKVSDLIKQFPSKVDRWSYRQVSHFIMKLLCLPNPLEIDIKNFIISREINGAKLLTLNEIQLKKLGFNKLWCYSLSVAIQDLKEIVSPSIIIPSVSVDSSDISPQELYIPTFNQVVNNTPLATEYASPSTSPKIATSIIMERENQKAILESQNITGEVKEISGKNLFPLSSNKEPTFEKIENPKQTQSSTPDILDSFDWVKFTRNAITISAILAGLSLLGSKAFSRK